MVEYLLRNWVTAIISTIIMVALLWYPDFAGYHHTCVSFRLPCTGILYDGTMFDSAGYRLITILIACVNGLAIMVLSVHYLPLGRVNRIVPFCYLLVVFSFPQARAFTTTYPALLLVVLGLFALFKSGESKSPTAPFFISSFLVGCGCLLFTTSWVVVVCFAAIALALNLLYGRNIFVFLGGFLLPIGCFLLYRHLFYTDLPYFLNTMYECFGGLRLQVVPRTPATLFLTIVYVYLFFRIFVRWLSRSFGNKTFRYRVLASFVWMMVICGVAAFFLSDRVIGYLPVMAIPASILFAYYFSDERITKRMKVEFTVLLFAVTLNQVAYFLQP